MKRLNFLLISLLCLSSGGLLAGGSSAYAQQETTALPAPLFDVSFDHGTQPEIGAGNVQNDGNAGSKFVEGVRGQAVLIGASSSLSYPLAGNLNSTTGTIAFWAKPVGWSGAHDSFRYLVSLVGENDWIVLQTVENSLGLLGGNRKAYNVNTASISDWPDGVWRFVTITWQNGANRLYLDGKPVGITSTWPVTPTELGARILLGGQLFNSSQGLTAIDDFEIYGNALSASQISALYAQGVQTSPALKQEYDFRQSQEIIEPQNLLKPEYGAILLPSSQSMTSDTAIEKAMDGDFQTFWVSALGTFPNWVEARWPQPVTVERLVVNEPALNRSARYSVEAYLNGKWQNLIAGTPNNARAGERLNISFNPVETTRLRFTMLQPIGNAAQATSSLQEIQIIGHSASTEAMKLMHRPNWKSQWIWYPEGAVSNVVRYFRRHFTITDLTTIQQAFLQIGADDNYEVYLNGQPVGKGGIPTDLYDVTGKIKAGDNVIAVKAQEFDIFEGVIAELTLNRKNGEVERITTDKSWKSSNADIPRWFDPLLADTDWLPAKEEGQPPFSANHAEQNYHNVATPEKFFFKSLQQSAVVVRPASKVRLTVQMSALQPLHHDYGFELRVGETSVSQYNDYTVASIAALPPVPTSRWQPGQLYRVTFDLYVPEWAPHGPIPIAIEPVGDEVEGRIGNVRDNIIGSLRIQRFATEPKPWPAQPPKAEIRQLNGRPVLFVNGRILPPFIQTVESYTTYQTMGEYAKSGNHFWRLWAQRGLNSPDLVDNPAKATAEFLKAVDQRINAMLKIDPQAYIIFGTQLRVPKEWTDKYPDDATILSDGRHIEYSLSSRRWLRETQENMRALVQHLMKQSYAGHVIGVHFDLAGETYYWGANINTASTPRGELILGDYSPEHIRAFRIWLKEKYRGNLAALRTAWKDETVTFENAAPNPAVLRRADLGMFRDPAKTRMPFDYWEFHSDVMAQRVNDIARIIKEASGGRYITGFWGLYSNGFNSASSSPGKLQHVAYAGLQKVLRAPYVDYIANLQAYAHTRWGTPMVPTNLADSIRRSGKMMLVEYDVRTFFTPVNFTERTYSEPETLSIFRRDIAAAAVRGDALWWVGFAQGTTGRISVPWFDEDSLLDTLKRERPAYAAAYRSGSKPNAEVAVFMNNADVYALDALTGHNLLQSAQYQVAYYQLPKLGTPVDCYELQDIDKPLMDRYKVYVFLNAYNVSPELRARIKIRVERAGKTAVWLYAPGFSDGAKLSTANIKALTGFSVDYDNQMMVPSVQVTPGTAWTRDVEANHVVKPAPYAYNLSKFEIGPIFNIDDAEAQSIGTYTHNNKIAYAVKKSGAGTAILLTIPFIDSTLLRSICREAGVHLYANRDVFLDAGSHLLSITADSGGFDDQIKLPGVATVYDIYARKIVARNVGAFHAQVAPNTTGFYFTGSPAEVAEFARQVGP